ncbi:Uncharacterized protein FWK35_00036352, partial [Aphis craccivora]
PRQPRIIIYDVDNDLSEVEIADGLLLQNPELGLTQEEIKSMSVKHKLGPKNGSTTHYVIETPASILPKLENKLVYLGMTRCRVKIHKSTTQCYRCQKFGHTSLKCNQEKPVCRHCAEEHDSRECMQNDKAICANCKKDHKSSSSVCKLNVNRQKIASLQLRDFCDKIGADVVLIQEPVMSPNKIIYGFENCKQVSGGVNAGAVVIVMNNELRVIELADMTTQHVVAVKIHRSYAAEAVTVVSAYFKYNMPTPCFIEKLRLILDRESRTIIGADVNGHSPMWHCPDRNNRGLYTEELIEDYDLTIANRQNCIRTYNREGMGSSNIDVTLLTPQVRNKIGGWSVHDNTDSDHNTISFILSLRDGGTGCPTAYRFNTCRADWEGFTRCLHRLKPAVDSSSIETQACTITGVIQTAAVECIPQIKRKSSRVGEPPWWTPELTSLRKDISRKRRMGLHRHDRYLSSIRQAKAAAWREFAGDINGNKWGKAFRYAKRGSVTRRAPSTMQRPDGIYTETLAETAYLLLGSFFPSEDHDRAYQTEGLLTPYERPVDTERVKTAIWRMKPRKAPGADGITAGILRKAWPVLAQEITRLFRECMVKATFPQVWKNAKLVVIPKPGKADMANPKAYRPVSLLPTLAKALETLIIRDLETETKLNEHTPQHGFVPGRSTS